MCLFVSMCVHMFRPAAVDPTQAAPGSADVCLQPIRPLTYRYNRLLPPQKSSSNPSTDIKHSCVLDYASRGSTCSCTSNTTVCLCLLFVYSWVVTGGKAARPHLWPVFEPPYLCSHRLYLNKREHTHKNTVARHFQINKKQTLSCWAFH